MTKSVLPPRQDLGGNYGRKRFSPKEALGLAGQEAGMTGLNKYTVRDYRRRYAQGDDSWAYRERV